MTTFSRQDKTKFVLVVVEDDYNVVEEETAPEAVETSVTPRALGPFLDVGEKGIGQYKCCIERQKKRKGETESEGGGPKEGERGSP